MKAVGWNNGKFHKSGAGYGIKISTKNRDEYFQRKWDFVYINFGKKEVIKINITPSFSKPPLIATGL